jgi:hypothetical protein
VDAAGLATCTAAGVNTAGLATCAGASMEHCRAGYMCSSWCGTLQTGYIQYAAAGVNTARLAHVQQLGWTLQGWLHVQQLG